MIKPSRRSRRPPSLRSRRYRRHLPGPRRTGQRRAGGLVILRHRLEPVDAEHFIGTIGDTRNGAVAADQTTDPIDREALSASLAQQNASIQDQLNAPQTKRDKPSVSDMFETQMRKNKLSQLSEISTSVVTASDSAIASMARNVQGCRPFRPGVGSNMTAVFGPLLGMSSGPNRINRELWVGPRRRPQRHLVPVPRRHTVDRIGNRHPQWSREELLFLDLSGRTVRVLPRRTLECVTRIRPASMAAVIGLRCIGADPDGSQAQCSAHRCCYCDSLEPHVVVPFWHVIRVMLCWITT